jgi:aspartyl-tRNA(Asn)/glutamyl-tRNA(Gln) amidotransferase subunit B
MDLKEKYETVVGLEVHLQLSTRSKAFCGCSTAFGASPNSHVCPVCLGLPGALPVLNEQAFLYSIKIAVALGCDIQHKVKFDRKNYYYPDLPKNYQISQFDMPLAYNGRVTIDLEDGTKKDIGITRAHMEEDAGKLLHVPGKGASFVDLNRTGTPLLEIVSEPDIRTPQEAHSYLTNLKRIIKYLGVSDCNMEEGSLRCDANISVRPRGQAKLGSKVEIKNMNSFKAVKDALVYEEKRQMELAEEKQAIAMETRLWDDKKGITLSMRSKEDAHDYRYFPEPDLVPFEVAPELVEKTRKDLPELPQAKLERFKKEHGLSGYDADVLTNEREIACFFEETARLTDPESASNWVKGEIMMHMNERKATLAELGITPARLSSVMIMAKKGVLSNLSAKEVLRECIDTKEEPETIVKKKGLEQVSDTSELEAIIDKVVEGNKRSVDDFMSGKDQALGFLVGQTMKLSGGKANPKIVNELLRKRLGGR